jgi:cytoskeletal protein CcmA (bactofilin family)
LKKGKTTSEFGRGGELNTIIGKGTSVQGDFRVQNSLRIDGKVIGDIVTSETVIIGKEGIVEGTVQAKNVLLGGMVKGNIVTTGKVFLEMTASINGDITASQLVVDEGALFDGKCSMKVVTNNKELK